MVHRVNIIPADVMAVIGQSYRRDIFTNFVISFANEISSFELMVDSQKRTVALANDDVAGILLAAL